MALGPVMLDLAGTTITPEEQEMLQHPACGGVILFSRNHESPEQLRTLISRIRSLRTPPLLIAVDHEGGRVQRFRDRFTRLPPPARIGALWHDAPQHAARLAELAGWLIAAELRSVDIDLGFAPVLDLDHGLSEIIGDRAWHHDPQAVTELASSFMKGMNDAGMAAVGKHFPGHGAVREDSHLALPVDGRPAEEIRRKDLLPFAHLIKRGIAGIMPAHVVYRQVDPRPAGFSRYWLQDVLRRELGFQGVVFSDDLSMSAAEEAGDYPERAHQALAAGCDMVLVCNHPEKAAAVLDSLSSFANGPERARRLERLYGTRGMPMDELKATKRWQEASTTLTALNPDPEREHQP